MGIGSIIIGSLADFGRRTTIGGLSNAGITESRVRKAYWIVVFFILMIFTFQAIVNNIVQYLKFEVTTSTDLTYSNLVTFPALTVCSMNRYTFEWFQSDRLKKNKNLCHRVHCLHLYEQIFGLKSMLNSMQNSTFKTEVIKKVN
jgi:hypothetical protein